MWILLHLTSNVAPYSSCDDLLARSPLKTMLRQKGINNYEKGDASTYEAISAGVADARVRAKQMNERTLNGSAPDKNNPYFLNPYTDVYELLDAIDAFIEQQ